MLRPDVRKGVFVLVALAVAGTAIVAAILIGDAPTVFAPVVAAAFALMILLAVGGLLGARIILSPREIVVKWLFVRRRRPRAHVAEAVRATITAPRGAAGESLFLLGPRRDLVIRISGAGYTREDLDRLVDALGVPCRVFDGPVTPGEFAESYPGLLPQAERHPYRIAFAVTGVVCAAVLALVLVSVATAS
ncbi:hypothetical protein [Actinomadura sp. 21ATH]|uniref:hypothetical protein n=1 Tax=Actinomadura sp. 21ATH TaxID=1735444 RepID=UPI0035C09522